MYKFTFNGNKSIIAYNLSEALQEVDSWDSIETMKREKVALMFPTHPYWVAPDDFNLELIPAGFENSSYRNDELPCFSFVHTHKDGISETVIYFSIASKTGEDGLNKYAVWVCTDGVQIGDCLHYGADMREAAIVAASARDLITKLIKEA